MEKNAYQAPAVLSVSTIHFETQVSGSGSPGSGTGGGFTGTSISSRVRGIDFTLPFLPKSKDSGDH